MDGEPALTLQQLIRRRMDERNWSYSDLQRESGHRLSRGRWQQLGSGLEQRRFPDPATLVLLAQVLAVDETTVVLAAAATVGLAVRRPTTGLAQLLPAGADRLPERMRDAILGVVRAAVADHNTDHATDHATAPGPAEGTASADGASHLSGLTLEWPKSAAPSLRGAEPEAARPDSP